MAVAELKFSETVKEVSGMPSSGSFVVGVKGIVSVAEGLFDCARVPS